MSPREVSVAPPMPSDTNPGESSVTTTPPPRETVVRVAALVKDYEERRILDGVSFELERGKVYSIIGPSGCGKTTLLKSMLGLVGVSSGSIELLGVDVVSAHESQVDEVRRRIGVVFQSSALLSSISVIDNVTLPLRLNTAKPATEIREIAEHRLELVGMKDALNRKPGELSGGMKKRCALARAIVLDPDLLFLDEPTSGADPVTAAVLDDLIVDLTRRIGCTAVAVTHEMRTAFRLSHEILMLWHGRIHHKGTPASFIESDDRLINQFVQGRKDGPMSA